jgi:hypothetical protein
MEQKLLRLSHILLIQLAIFALVEGRSVVKRDAVDTTTEINQEIATTIQPETLKTTIKIESLKATIEPETSTTVSNDDITFDISR